MIRSQTLFVFAAVGIVAALAGALLACGVPQSPSASVALQNGTMIDPPRPTQSFALVDQNDAPFDNTRMNGHWTLMLFGFTNCGDVCPTTLAMLASVTKSLTDLPAAQRPQVVFVSVDATRDSSQVMKAYLQHFDPSFIGVTGAQADLDTFARSLGIASAIRPLDNGGYAVEHSASILAFNHHGEMRALFSPPQTVASLTSDYKRLAGFQ